VGQILVSPVKQILYSVRVYNCSGVGSVSTLLLGVDWVKANGVRPAVVNISSEYGGSSPSVDTSINDSINAGLIYVVASGNNGLKCL
jgi:hypothetical protein